jgi:hypothetical protein
LLGDPNLFLQARYVSRHPGGNLLIAIMLELEDYLCESVKTRQGCFCLVL